MSFRRQGSTSWQTARVPGADAQYFVYSNDSVRPYTPFEVKIRSYNRRGEGPESLVAVVYSAEEGGPPGPPGAATPAACLPGVGWGKDFTRLGSTGGAGETPGCLPQPWAASARLRPEGGSASSAREVGPRGWGCRGTLPGPYPAPRAF